MDLTLDDVLQEVDRWKQIVSDRMAGLDAEQRKVEDEKAMKWLEEKLGRKLPEAPPRWPHIGNPQSK